MIDRAPAGPHEVVDAAFTSRKSERAFLDTPVPRLTVREILAIAARAPSGTNTQPWGVVVLTGEAKRRLSGAILTEYRDPERRARHTEEYPYYPAQRSEPYRSRRRRIGWDLYGPLGIGRQDKAGMHAQHARNDVFFDAPVGMIFTIDRSLARGSWLDCGMFLQNIMMIAARAHGLDSCPQAAFAQFHRVIRAQLGLTEDRVVVCGMSLGHAEMSRVENSLRTEREPVEGFARFLED